MLKSLFESSIDMLNIPADMKTAIKHINNICLEAEGDDKENDLGYTPLSEEDKKKAEQIKADQERKEQAEKDKQKDENVPTTIDDAESDDDIWKVLKNLQKKAVKNRGTKDGEKWRQKLEDEYQKATSTRDFKRVKGLEMTIYNKGNQQHASDEKAVETKTAEQAAQNTDHEDNKGIQTAKGATREPSQVRTSGPASSEPNNGTANADETQQAQNNEGSTKAVPATEEQPTQAEVASKSKLKFRADVMTVQLFLRATKPQTNLAYDGILGPKTITAIQQTSDIIPTGKMDQKTQEEFHHLLAEAKQKVIPIQKQLGVTADGLIGKQTLAALQNANINVTSVFNGNPTAQQTTPTAQQTQVANNQVNINVLAQKFNESTAQNMLKSKYITQKQYNIWKTFGISPVYQKRYPQETQNQIAQIRKKQQEANGQQQQQQVANQGNAQPASQGGQQNAKNNDYYAKTTKNGVTTELYGGTVSYINLPPDEKKVYDDAKKKFSEQYIKRGNNEQIAWNRASMKANDAVLKYRRRKANKPS